MSVLNRLKRLVGAGGDGPAGPALREGTGVTVDPDEGEWRRLTGNGNRDLAPLTQTRMQELAVYLWESNPLANRLVELPVAYLLAEGVRLQVRDADAQGWLDAFWRDPINNLDIKLPQKMRELALYGEQCWPVFVNEISGHTRLGYLDPGLIETVVTDPDNAEQPIGIVTVKDRRGRARRYRVIVNGPEAVFAERTREIRAGFTDGECFYFSVNRLSNGRRGRSDLLAQMDWLDAYEQFTFGELERAALLRAFIWDVTMKGATREEVEARARQIGVPAAGSVRVHNDAEEWQAVSPDLAAGDTSESARLFRNHVLGGSTIPEHWFGGGGDVNRSTGESMGEPTFKVFSARQRVLKHILEEVGTFVIDRRLDPTGRSAQDPETADPDLAVEAVFPELTARDTSKYAAALQQVVAAAALGVDRGLMTELLALDLIAAIAGRLGVEIDPEEELARAREEASARAERDSFPEPPDDPGADRTA